ncbi:hypothetical protein FHS09_000597 [Microbulbifer rhizosphaerae]|uniref:Uncharacterized protein n=1 Tax=Microbulbifer rhizosphaerae TaxID=1562603 RepID=A0A7W4Z911_9GAMM|nr:hypothetical protein [Microbulbifer rhizosphaerae]
MVKNPPIAGENRIARSPKQQPESLLPRREVVDNNWRKPCTGRAHLSGVDATAYDEFAGI